MAFGVMTFVRFPTLSLSDHHVEGGLILPLAVHKLPAGLTWAPWQSSTWTATTGTTGTAWTSFIL
jgi:hypothetical protein